MHVRRKPLLQSLDYARAVGPLYRQKPMLGLIKINSEDAGLCLMMEVAAFGTLMQVLMLDRGPVWFDGFGTKEHFETFTAEFHRQFPPRFGRKRRFIPEMEKSGDILGRHKFRKTGAGYETLWLDITAPNDDLRAGLKKKWRGSLTKAEGARLEIQWNEPEKHVGWFLSVYSQDKQEKDYRGASVKTLAALGSVFHGNKNLLIGRALKGDICVGAVMLLCHGASATYQAGWSNDMGRKLCAHHLLLWQALDVLKHKGIKDFDLGGVNDHEAAGVRKFKEGLGGHLVVLPGLYT